MKKILAKSFITIKTTKVCGNVRVEISKEIYSYRVEYRVYTYTDDRMTSTYTVSAYNDMVFYHHSKIKNWDIVSRSTTKIDR